MKFFHLPEKKIVVIYEGVEEYFFEEQKPDFVQKILNKYHIDKHFILFVGERTPHKNIDGFTNHQLYRTIEAELLRKNENLINL